MSSGPRSGGEDEETPLETQLKLIAGSTQACHPSRHLLAVTDSLISQQDARCPLQVWATVSVSLDFGAAFIRIVTVSTNSLENAERLDAGCSVSARTISR